MSEQQIFNSDGLRVALSHEHRGGLAADPASLRPSASLIERIGGAEQVKRIIETLYERIANDIELRQVFPHFETGSIKGFFVEWMGGPPSFSNSPWFPKGLDRFHRGVHITPTLAQRWLEHFGAALAAHEVDVRLSEEFLPHLRTIARRLTNAREPTADADDLIHSCSGVQTTKHAQREKLRTAAAGGRLAAIKDACEADTDLVHWRGSNGRSLLWEAAARGRTKLVEYLLQAGANPNWPGCEPAEINLACSGKAGINTGVMVTPWTLASARQHRKVASALAQQGALGDVFSAAYLGDCPFLKTLLKLDARLLHAEDPADDFKCITPLHHAIAGGQIDAAEMLIEQGAEVASHSTWLLTHAALQDRADLVQLLLDHGADVRRCVVLGPLDRETRPVADLLVERGYDINDNPAYHAMLVRACRGDVSSRETTRVESLLKYGADVNESGHSGLRPLHYAVRAGRIPLIQLLLDHGADIHVQDDQGLTPWDHLRKTRSKSDPIPVMQLLLDHGFDINHQIPSGDTILFYYGRRGDERTVQWLLDRGADSTIRNNSGRTAGDLIRRCISLAQDSDSP